MSLLAPLYFLGALAVVGPLVFHLIRRQPKSSVSFSSLMFLRETPPRISRKSRLDQWPLLLLRCLALLLLAAAFARPFLRSATGSLVDAPSRRIVVLVDRSASMRREDLWDRAVAEANSVLDELSDQDQFAVMLFDNDVESLGAGGLDIEKDTQGFGSRENSGSLATAFGADRVREAKGFLKAAGPSWFATDLGKAIRSAADWAEWPVQSESTVLSAAANSANPTGPVDSGVSGPATIVLISDLQSGADITELESYQWPDDVSVDIRQLNVAGRTNASLSLMSNDATDNIDSEPAKDLAAAVVKIPVRVTNSEDSISANFRLDWQFPQTAGSNPAVSSPDSQTLQIDPGSVQIFRMPLDQNRSQVAGQGSQLQLSGDDHPFDNVRYLVPPSKQSVSLGYIGPDANDPQSSLAYYLSRVPLANSTREVEFNRLDQTDNIQFDAGQTPLLVVAESLNAANQQNLNQYAEAGGNVLFVLGDADSSAGIMQSVRDLTGDALIQSSEANVGDYSMLTQIDFADPLFAAMADPQYNDFTKIKFWKHRIITNQSQQWDVIAAFDSGSPAILRWQSGDQNVWLMAAGWQPTQSQLALSTKFIPLMSRWFNGNRNRDRQINDHELGAPLPWIADTAAAELVVDDKLLTLINSDGVSTQLTNKNLDEIVTAPGIYQLMRTDQPPVVFASNLAVSESRTMPLDVGVLERLGIRLGQNTAVEKLVEIKRQMRDRELEGQQRIWQWLLFAAIGFLSFETWLGGRNAKRIV